MHGFPILPWLALVAVYIATGRTRGSSWTSLAMTAGGVFAAVFLEFALAFTLGLAGFGLTLALAASAFLVVTIARRARRSSTAAGQPGFTGSS